MKWIWENKPVAGVIVATIVLLITIAFTSGEGARQNLGTDGVGLILRPFEQFFTGTAKNVGGFFMHFKDLEKAQDENAILAQRLAEAEENARDIQNYRTENDELRSLLNLKNGLKNENWVAANIIAKDYTNWYSVFTIDKGTNDGVFEKKAVRATAGLVGYVLEASFNTAKVVTILNEGTAVSANIVRTNEAAICEGEFALSVSGQCRLSKFSGSAMVATGDVIQTSGMGGIFPKGILIGTVGEVSLEKQSISTTAVLVPAVDFERVMEVLVAE